MKIQTAEHDNPNSELYYTDLFLRQHMSLKQWDSTDLWVCDYQIVMAVWLSNILTTKHACSTGPSAWQTAHCTLDTGSQNVPCEPQCVS